MSGLRFFQLIFHPTNSATLIPNLFSKSFQRYPFARQNFADNRRGILLSKAGDWYKAGIKCSFYICLPWEWEKIRIICISKAGGFITQLSRSFFQLRWTKTIVSRPNSHSCKNPPLSHMTDSRKTSGNIIFIDSRMNLTDFGKTVENYSYFLRPEKNCSTTIQ